MSTQGNKRSDTTRPPGNNVLWQAVLEKEEAAFQEPESTEPVASFPDEVTDGCNVEVIRASVYVEDNEDGQDSAEFSREEEDEEVRESAIPKVNSNSKLLDMETFSESDASDEDSVGKKMCCGPDLSPIPGCSALSTFVLDVEKDLERPTWSCEHNFNSSNSLDIEKELNELLGTLCVEQVFAGTPKFPNETEEYDNVTEERQQQKDGSEVNLGYTETDDGESLCSSEASDWTWQPNCHFDPYWTSQRRKSKSVIDGRKLGVIFRNGKQRMSMIEFGSKRRRDRRTHSIMEPEPSSIQLRQPRFLRSAYDRSSVLEPRVSSVVSLPGRPHSALAQKYESSSSLGLEPRDSLRTSGGYDDNIDWTWLEDAIKDLDGHVTEAPDVTDKPKSRVDAGCQTGSDQCWPGEEERSERMREAASSERLPESTPSIPSSPSEVSSERRGLEINGGCGGCDEDMSGKTSVEGSGPSGVSSWLRQSMRRVRHFNLGEPPRIRSAPPDTFRVGVESVASESVSPVVTQSEQIEPPQQTRPRSAGVRVQGRQALRARPASAPARRSSSATTQQQPADAPAAPAGDAEAQDNLGYESDSTDRHPSPRGRRRRLADEGSQDCDGRSPLGAWPHGLSSVLAGLGCTLGLFNISRFAILSVHFGFNFILQFLVLSLILGVPLLAFHASLGQTLAAGPVDMWKISPLFQGIGIALLLAQALIGIYSVVGVSWMFVYFRDSFITKQDTYTWAKPFGLYREDNYVTLGPNTSWKLEDTVPDYLNGVVLQRHGLASPENAFGHLKFQPTFNLAVIWMIVFVSLSKGLRSYGKVVYVFSLLPVLGTLVICSKLLGITPVRHGLFPQTEWSEFFLNTKSWISAATEVMLTWNLLGAATMQVTSHNRATKKLWRDVVTITLLTLLVLILAAFLGNTCHQLLSVRGYSYIPSSFERMSSYSFLRPANSPLPPGFHTQPVRWMAHASLVAGDRVGRPGGVQDSGYQVVRLATELVPATLALLGGDLLSPFWAVLFYFTLILFGVAQQLAIWHCVITGIMAINAPSLKSWETTITFFTCAAGFVLGLPMTTELGVFVVYFLDYCVGGGWWILLLTLVQMCAVLMVRGRPYSGENISVALFGKASSCLSLWAVPMLTFSWNVIMPVALLVICITIFKSGGYRDLWTWRCIGRDYWPLWAREVGVFVQIVPLLCVPLVALIQCYRFLSTGPPDIFDRLANLYRPSTDSGVIRDTTASLNSHTAAATAPSGATELPPAEDPPPKYTPPPSYSTATGARIAKMLRQSFRRSVRRIQSVLGPEVHIPTRPPPPDYASVLVEMNQDETTVREEIHHTPETNNFTAADVAQVLRCSFRRVNNANVSTSHVRTTNNPTPQTLVIPSQWDP